MFSDRLEQFLYGIAVTLHDIACRLALEWQGSSAWHTLLSNPLRVPALADLCLYSTFDLRATLTGFPDDLLSLFFEAYCFCSACGAMSPYFMVQSVPSQRSASEFCPRCGAAMSVRRFSPVKILEAAIPLKSIHKSFTIGSEKYVMHSVFTFDEYFNAVIYCLDDNMIRQVRSDALQNLNSDCFDVYLLDSTAGRCFKCLGSIRYVFYMRESYEKPNNLKRMPKLRTPNLKSNSVYEFPGLRIDELPRIYRRNDEKSEAVQTVEGPNAPRKYKCWDTLFSPL